MKEWFPSKELVGLSGMPKTPKGVRQKAKKEDWRTITNNCRGGKREEYHITSLPKTTRIELAKRAASKTDTKATRAGKTVAKKLKEEAKEKAQTSKQVRQSGLKDFSLLTETGKKRADAKLAILGVYKTFLKASGLPVCRGMKVFTEKYNGSEINVDPWVLEAKRKISVASLRAWDKKVQNKGVAVLGGNYGNRQASSKIDRQPDLKQFVIAMMTEHPHASSSLLMQAVRARFGKTDFDLPSSRSLGRYVDKWKQENSQIFTAVINPDKWKNEFMLAFGSASEDVIRLNQRWEFDSTPADVMLTDGRYSILGVIDIFSRRSKLLVSKTSKATAVASLTRRSILNWGVPEEAKTDNGKDYTSKHMQRVFTSLDINQTLCNPFASWEKPHIERFFRTFSHGIVELLPGYIGHNVAERKAIEARKSFAQRLMVKGELVDIQLNSLKLQEICDRWVENYYHHVNHDALGKTPFQMVIGWTEPIRKIEDERVLDVLLAEAPSQSGWRSLGKKGIKVDGFTFIHEDLGACESDRVKVFYDEYDMGKIYVYGGPDMKFICVAECPELTGISRKEVAKLAKAKQREMVKEKRKELKAASRKANVKDIVDEILTAAEEKAGHLVQFRQSEIAHTSHGINEAQAALEARKPRQEPAHLFSEEEFAAARAEIEAKKQAEAKRKAEQALTFDTPYEKTYYLVRESQSRILNEEESEFVEEYRREHPQGFRLISASLGKLAVL